MHTDDLSGWEHDHIFGQDKIRAGERRTLIIVVLTAVMMLVEIIGGLIYGSMALLADGLHMASHATALGIAFLAYIAARRYAEDPRFSFGTGKLTSLAGFASAVLLAGFAFLMVSESTQRLISPVEISYDQALLVAVIGLVVNVVSAWVLASTPHDHAGHEGHSHGHDHNLRAAYLHVIADALTSGLAIIALLAGKYFGAAWLDPAMGLVGAALIIRWSYGLIRESAKVLLDRQAHNEIVDSVRDSLEKESSDRVVDLHVWQIGHNAFAAAIALVTHTPQPPGHYKRRIPDALNIVHATFEIHCCDDGH